MDTEVSRGRQVLTCGKSGFGLRHNQPKPTARPGVVKNSNSLERTYAAFSIADDWG